MHHQDKHKYQGLLFSHTSTITSVRVVEKEQGGARKFCCIEELTDKSVPIQLAQSRFPGLAISISKI